MKNEKPDGVEAMRKHDWEGVARSYNGKYWKTHNPGYAVNLGKYFEQFK
jgi:hypothetical protein